MNCTIKKTFYTSSTESLFLRYKKIFKEAVKLGCTNHFKIFVKLYYEKPSALGGNVSPWPPDPLPPPSPPHTPHHQHHHLLAPFKKGLSLPLTLAKKKTYLDTQLKGELIDLFWKLPWCRSRNRMITTVVINNIIPTCKR